MVTKGHNKPTIASSLFVITFVIQGLQATNKYKKKKKKKNHLKIKLEKECLAFNFMVKPLQFEDNCSNIAG